MLSISGFTSNTGGNAALRALSLGKGHRKEKKEFEGRESCHLCCCAAIGAVSGFKSEMCQETRHQRLWTLSSVARQHSLGRGGFQPPPGVAAPTACVLPCRGAVGAGDGLNSSLGQQRAHRLWWLNAGAEGSGLVLTKAATGCGGSRKAGERHGMRWGWACSRRAQDLGATERNGDVQR